MRKRFSRPAFLFLSSFTLLLAANLCATAQDKRTAADGVFTAAQAARGKTAYFNECVACHGGELQGEEDNPPLTGKPFIDHWGGKPVSGLFGFINRMMPPGNGGSLGANGDADVLAYILSQNGFPAGAAELPTDPKILSTVTINKPDQQK